jgi:hypothetical protein
LRPQVNIRNRSTGVQSLLSEERKVPCPMEI